MIRLYFIGFIALFIGSCDQRRGVGNVLSVDSSFTVIKQTAPVFADSCVPMCWPRVFKEKPDRKQYRVFNVSSTIPGDGKWFSNQAFAKQITDSLSYPLLTYLNTLPARELMPARTTGAISRRLHYEVFNQLHSRKMDSATDVGYLQVSQVIVDSKSGRGVYVIQQRGTGYVEWLVQIRWVNGHWQFVRKDRMSIS